MLHCFRLLAVLTACAFNLGAGAGEVKPEVVQVLSSDYWDAYWADRATQGGDDRVFFPLQYSIGFYCGALVTIDTSTGTVTPLVLDRWAMGCGISGLAADKDGVLWGTTQADGPHGRGSLFRIPVGGQPEVVHAFTEAEGYSGGQRPVPWPDGSLRLARSNTPLGKLGQLERYTPPNYEGEVYRLFSEADGMGYPGALTSRGDGFVYGLAGSTEWGGGVNFFRVDEAGELQVLATFVDRDANYDIVDGGDGNLYLTSRWKRRVGTGSGDRLMKVTPDGGVIDLHRYRCRTGCHPWESPSMADDGWLYGLADCGSFDSGVIYHVRPDGSGYEKIFNFDRGKQVGSYPNGGLFQARDGFLYGHTRGYPTIFRFAPPPSDTARPVQRQPEARAEAGRQLGTAKSSCF